MLLLTPSYFQGDIAIPQLPVSRINEDNALYGTALAIQSTGENNLLTYIDTKITEYLYKTFGDKLGNKILAHVEANGGKVFIDTVVNINSAALDYQMGINVDVDVEPLIPYLRKDVTFNAFRVNDGFDDVLTKISDEWIGRARVITYKILPNGTDFDGEHFVIRYVLNDANNISTLKSFRYIGEVIASSSHPTDLSLLLKANVKTTPIGSPLERTKEDIVLDGLLSALMYQDGKVLRSPMANYVYYWLNRDGFLNATATGEADLNFSRATSAYETDKLIKVENQNKMLVRAWNDMVDMNRTMWMWFLRHAAPYLQDYNSRYDNTHLFLPISSFNFA